MNKEERWGVEGKGDGEGGVLKRNADGDTQTVDVVKNNGFRFPYY